MKKVRILSSTLAQVEALQSMFNPQGFVEVEPEAPDIAPLKIVGYTADHRPIVWLNGERWVCGQLVLWNGNGYRIHSLKERVNGKAAFSLVSELDLVRRIRPAMTIMVPVEDVRVIQDVEMAVAEC